MLAVRMYGTSISMISCHDALLSWVQGGRKDSVYFILEEKMKLELSSRNFEKSPQFVWERTLTVTKHHM